MNAVKATPQQARRLVRNVEAAAQWTPPTPIEEAKEEAARATRRETLFKRQREMARRDAERLFEANQKLESENRKLRERVAELEAKAKAC